MFMAIDYMLVFTDSDGISIPSLTDSDGIYIPSPTAGDGI